METIEQRMARYRNSFEVWAEECVKIVDKESGREVPLRLNPPQRRLVGLMERQRRSGRPVRIIMLKARQWGGSTLVQVYMAWMQLVVRKGWNSLTCAHVKDASAAIRGMYTRLLRCYPSELKEGKEKDWALTPYEKSQSASWVPARGCQVAIATSLSPNSVRGSNFAMAHLSEVAFWADGDAAMAEEIVRTVSGTVLRCEDSVVVMESTANGRDNYFYREWKRAEAGESDKEAVFVPWHEIELYRRSVGRQEMAPLLASLDEYERRMLEQGVELESVAWYHDKRREYQTHEAMMAEFPSTPEEAFSTSRGAVFDASTVPTPSEATGRMASLAVYIPGRPDLLSLFALDDGRLTALSDLELSGEGGTGLQEALRRAERLPMMVVESADADPGHGAWCARMASEAGAALVYDGDDGGWWRPDGMTLSEWVDTLAEMLREGKVRETSDMKEVYGGFRHERPMRTPAVLARLAAAHYQRTRGAADDFSSLWLRF